MTMLTDPWVPRGTLVEAHLTANTTINVTATSLTDVTGTVSTNGATGAAGTLQVTATVLAGRRYWLEFFGMPFSSAAGDQAGVAVTDGGGTGQGYQPRVNLATANFGYDASIVVPLYASVTGSVTYKVRLLRVSGGAGNVNLASWAVLRLRDDGLAP